MARREATIAAQWANSNLSWMTVTPTTERGKHWYVEIDGPLYGSQHFTDSEFVKWIAHWREPEKAVRGEG